MTPNAETVGLVLIAPAIGSFLGVVVRRLPAGQAFGWSRSYCECCRAILAVRDLVPLISWLLSLGHCRYCNARLSWFYPSVEGAALVIAMIAVALDDTPRAWLDCLFGYWLLVLAWIDLREGILPDVLTLPLIVVGLIEASLLDAEALLERAAGAVFGYVILRGIGAAYHAMRRRDGIGEGDAKLTSAIGAWVGAAALPQVIFAAAFGGLTAAAVLRLRGVRLHWGYMLPFGPFLAAAAWLVWMSQAAGLW